MPTVKVYGNKPDSGPKQLKAGAVCEEINEAHTTWKVTMVWTADNTKYTSATAPETDFEKAVEAKLPGYLYLTS